MKVTLIGMERYLNNKTEPESIFDNISLPVSDLLEKEVLTNTILLDCGEFETLYSDPFFMKQATEHFFLKHGRTFKKWADALAIEYEPLQNYDRHDIESYEDDIESILTSHEGKRKTTEVDGSTTDTTKAGKVQNTSTKPDTTTNTNGFAGFSAAGNSLNTGSTTTSKVGNSESGTYTETDVTEQLTDTEVSHVMSTPHTIETGHEADNNDVVTTVKKPRTFRAYGNIGVTTSQQMLQSEIDISKFNLYKEISRLYMSELTLPIYI